MVFAKIAKNEDIRAVAGKLFSTLFILYAVVGRLMAAPGALMMVISTLVTVPSGVMMVISRAGAHGGVGQVVPRTNVGMADKKVLARECHVVIIF